MGHITVRIMRGLPGSGKSHFGTKVLPKNYSTEALVCSADHYFLDEHGNYNFDMKQLPQAHRECRKKFLEAIQAAAENGSPARTLIVVDNTNTMPTEIAFYYELATLYTNDVEIITVAPPPELPQGDWLQQCFEQNQHNVPLKQIKDMADRIHKHKVPWYWREKIVVRHDGYFIYHGVRYEA